MDELIRKIQNIKAGDVIEYARGMVYLVTSRDKLFIRGKEVRYDCLIYPEETVLFTVKEITEKADKMAGCWIKGIIDMNEISRRYLKLA